MTLVLQGEATAARCQRKEPSPWREAENEKLGEKEQAGDRRKDLSQAPSHSVQRPDFSQAQQRATTVELKALSVPISSLPRNKPGTKREQVPCDSRNLPCPGHPIP